MNKLMGFYELKEMRIPSVPWKEFREDTVLDDSILWTVRTSVFSGKDQDLPRKIGVTADEAVLFGKQMLAKFRGNGMVVYYPYFVADKSGTLMVSGGRTVIEAVKGDLWNMVTYGKTDVTVIVDGDDGNIRYAGDSGFLSVQEQEKILGCAPAVRYSFRDDLLEGREVLLEWSFARKSTVEKEPLGDPYLVFYEARTV